MLVEIPPMVYFPRNGKNDPFYDKFSLRQGQLTSPELPKRGGGKNYACLTPAYKDLRYKHDAAFHLMQLFCFSLEIIFSIDPQDESAILWHEGFILQQTSDSFIIPSMLSRFIPFFKINTPFRYYFILKTLVYDQFWSMLLHACVTRPNSDCPEYFLRNQRLIADIARRQPTYTSSWFWITSALPMGFPPDFHLHILTDM